MVVGMASLHLSQMRKGAESRSVGEQLRRIIPLICSDMLKRRGKRRKKGDPGLDRGIQKVEGKKGHACKRRKRVQFDMKSFYAPWIGSLFFLSVGGQVVT